MIIVHKVFLKLINESDKENNSFSSHPINFPTFQLHALAALTTREEPYTVDKPGNTSTIDLKPKLEKIMKPAEPNIRKPDFRCKKCTVICQTSQGIIIKIYDFKFLIYKNNTLIMVIMVALSEILD